MGLNINNASSGPAVATLSHAPTETEAKVWQEAFFDAVAEGNSELVSKMLDRGGIDLTVINHWYGQAALNIAIEQGRNDVAKLLLGKCGDDPLVLNALDRRKHTPLTLAATMHNVDLLVDVIHASAATNDIPRQIPSSTTYGPTEIGLIKMLIEAKGDKTVALELAVKAHLIAVAKVLKSGGADPVAVLQRCAEQGDNGSVALLIREHLVFLGAIITSVHNEVEAGNVPAVQLLLTVADSEISKEISIELLQQYAEKGEVSHARTLIAAEAFSSDAIRFLGRDDTLSDDEKVRRMSVLIKAGGNADQILEKLASSKKMDQVKLLVRAGAPAVEVLMDLGRAGNRQTAQSLIHLGADAATAMSRLIEADEQDAANVLVVALAGAMTS